MANSFVLVFLLGTLISSTAAQNAPTFPLRYDPKTSQFYSTFTMGSRPATISAVLDLGAQFLWFSCDRYVSSTYAPIACGSTQCDLTGGFGCFGCNRPARPGCSNDTCSSAPYNPFQNTLVSQGFYQDTLRANAPARIPQFIFSCMPGDYLEGLAAGTTGMLGLARTAISVHKQVADKLGLPDKFSLCFPGSSGVGKFSIGVLKNSGISKSLVSTPLIINPNSTAPIFTEGDASNEYFINVTSVRVAGRALAVKDSYFSFDKNGVGGTKISTVQNYTAVHTSIYKPLVRAFNKAASDMKIKSAAAVAPFQACYRSASISRVAGAANVPTIDLVLPGKDVYWRIYGGNSMVEIDGKTTCLAMVDSGKQPRTSIAIGAHQLVENYLEFDLVSSVLKFSSSLLEQNKSCSRL